MKLSFIPDKLANQIIGKTAYFMIGMKSYDAWSSQAHLIYINHLLWLALIVELTVGTFNVILSFLFCNSIAKRYTKFPVQIEMFHMQNATAIAHNGTSNEVLGRTPQIYFENKNYPVYSSKPVQLEPFSPIQGKDLRPTANQHSQSMCPSPQLKSVAAQI